MKPELVEQLNQINREFYSTFAASFSETRSESARELERILPYIAQGARVLDIGCGNGRIAAMLSRRQRAVVYVGVDSSAEMIARCKMQANVKWQEADQIPSIKFFVADIMQPDWARCLVGEPVLFDCVLMLAVLHHIPGQDTRLRILQQVCDLLAPQGLVIASTWQFLENERMRKKIVPWSTVGIDERELEPGDKLLSWKRGGTGLRYCHWIGEEEMCMLAAAAGLAVAETFRAGGHEGNLSLYMVLKHAHTRVKTQN